MAKQYNLLTQIEKAAAGGNLKEHTHTTADETNFQEQWGTPDNSAGQMLENTGSNPGYDPYELGDGGTGLGESQGFVGGTYYIDPNKPNIITRKIYNFSYDHDDLTGGAVEIGIINDTIFELIPEEPVYPQNPPLSGDVYAVNWSRIVNYGGITDETKKEVDIESAGDWTLEEWETKHRWPAQYTLDPVYLFFTGDAATFYVDNAISYVHPKNGAYDVIPEEIVWKLDGKEVHKGWFLDMESVEETVTEVGVESPTEEGQLMKIMTPKMITVEINNPRGSIIREIKYAVVDSENASAIGGVDIESDVENFGAFFTGRFEPKTVPYTGVEYIQDERYKARHMYCRFKWKDLGKKESPVRQFKDIDATVKVDGVQVWKDTAIKLDGQKTAFGEFFDDWGAPLLTLVGGAVAVASAFIPGVGAIIPVLYGKIVTGAGLLSTGVGLGFDWSEIFGHDGNPHEGKTLADTDVTDNTALSDTGKSALLYHPPDDDEWNALMQFDKNPGPMEVEVTCNFTYRKGLFNLGKKMRRTYYHKFEFDLDLDSPIQPMDLGIHTVHYTDEKV